MAYVSPSSRSTGDIVTAAIWNQDVVNNEQASVPDVFTAAGDIAYATAADALTRLAIGTAGQVLRVSAGATAPGWGNHGVIGYTGAISGGFGTSWDIMGTVQITPLLAVGHFVVLGGGSLNVTSGTGTQVRVGNSGDGYSEVVDQDQSNKITVSVAVMKTCSDTNAHTFGLECQRVGASVAAIEDGWIMAIWVPW